MGQLRQLLNVLPDFQTLNVSFDAWWDIKTGVMFSEIHHRCLSCIITQGILFPQSAHFQKYLISHCLHFDKSSICLGMLSLLEVISLSLLSQTNKSGPLLLILTLDFNLACANSSALSFF